MFTNVSINEVAKQGYCANVETIKAHIIEGSGCSSWKKMSQDEVEQWIKATKRFALQEKYSPEQRYLDFVIRPFGSFVRAINRSTFVVVDKETDYFNDCIIGPVTPTVKLILEMPNEKIKKLTIDGLSATVAIYNVAQEILDEEFEALENMFYKAFPLDIQLPTEPESVIEVQDTTASGFEPYTETIKVKAEDADEKSIDDQLDALLKLLEILNEAAEKSEKKNNPKTKQDIASNFINSPEKKQDKKNSFSF